MPDADTRRARIVQDEKAMDLAIGGDARFVLFCFVLFCFVLSLFISWVLAPAAAKTSEVDKLRQSCIKVFIVLLPGGRSRAGGRKGKRKGLGERDRGRRKGWG